MTADPSTWDQERDRIHDAVAGAVHDLRGDMLLSTVVVGVTVNSDGEKLLSCWTSPDLRQWETIGLLEYLRMHHAGNLAERHPGPGDDE
ncbi:hypothetical protein OG900_33300 [Streptomyces sp. NBC_00433]